MSESFCDSISNSMIMTCFCGELARCFTSRTPLNLGRRFYRCSKPMLHFSLNMENCEFWRWEDSSLENSSIEVNLLKSKLEVATLKMENLGESKIGEFRSLNYFEVNKSRNLEAKVSKLKMLCILSFTVFVVFVVAIFK
ncbi:hypothetical protein R3W88_007686 [Solanum pinnatisectum]|uniref:GRF-type domain-containing protein n=1 Tax=Solanum pinnatisectum TaxID=50273 RepID=A0AAV9M8U7_9SOLN|nr:hypothetical protein R3W88_007686 [Solanum pinnatisectum]